MVVARQHHHQHHHQATRSLIIIIIANDFCLFIKKYLIIFLDFSFCLFAMTLTIITSALNHDDEDDDDDDDNHIINHTHPLCSLHIIITITTDTMSSLLFIIHKHKHTQLIR